MLINRARFIPIPEIHRFSILREYPVPFFLNQFSFQIPSKCRKLSPQQIAPNNLYPILQSKKNFKRMVPPIGQATSSASLFQLFSSPSDIFVTSFASMFYQHPFPATALLTTASVRVVHVTNHLCLTTYHKVPWITLLSYLLK